MPESSIFTIGHSRHKLPRFVGLLKRYNIKLVVDVRSAPYSRMAPHFNYGELEPALVRYYMYYKYMGNALGGRPADAQFHLESGGTDYEKLGADPRFNEGVARLAALARERVTAIMCSEEDPAKCHRTFLIAPKLAACGLDVWHIRGDGSTVAHQVIAADTARLKPQGKPAGDQLELF
jgi:uncharacterized protein (DUF488 family)